jgi:hypothetical protein
VEQRTAHTILTKIPFFLDSLKKGSEKGVKKGSKRGHFIKNGYLSFLDGMKRMNQKKNKNPVIQEVCAKMEHKSYGKTGK